MKTTKNTDPIAMHFFNSNVPYCNALFLDKTLDNYNEKEYEYNDGEEFFTARLKYLPKGVKLNSSRFEILEDLQDAVNNMFILNGKNVDKLHVFNFYSKQLKSKYIVLITDLEINEAIENCYNNFDNLTPTNITYKKIWINPTITNKKHTFNMAKKNMTKNKIDNYFNELINFSKTKVTYETIAQELQMALRTIKNYITPEQKQIIKSFNNSLKMKQIKLDDLFTTDIPAEPAEPKACPIKQSKVTTVTISIRENLNELFESYVITNNQGQYEFSDETFANILNHFNQSEIEWLKLNLNQCIELKKKTKIFDRTKRELLYIRFTDDDLITDSSIEYKPIDHHRMEKVNVKIEEVEYEDDADEDDDDLENEINENSYSKVKYY